MQNNNTMNILIDMLLPVNASDLFKQLDGKQSDFVDYAVANANGFINLEKVRKTAMGAWSWWNHATFGK